MEIYIEKENKTITKDFNLISAKELLKRLDIPLSNVIIIRNNEIITEDEILKKGDKIKLISVISGG